MKQSESFSPVLDVDPPQICKHRTPRPRLSSAVSLSPPPPAPTLSTTQENTFNVGVPSAVVTHSQRRAFPRLGAQRRLEQVVHALVVDFEEGHPQGELAADGLCRPGHTVNPATVWGPTFVALLRC